MRTIRLFRSMSGPVRLLLVNQCGMAVGFYLLVPYLATYLTNDLQMAAAVVGAVLGIRTFAQQGLTVVGGAAADRFGCRPVIIAGCALRTLAFAIFAFSSSAVGLMSAAVLTGLAGALFSPAVRTYLALEAADRRVDAFTLYSLTNTVGALAGPLLGSVLILVGFGPMALTSAVIFAVLTIAQARWLPARSPQAPAGPLRASWRQVTTDRRFMVFTVACAGMLTLYNQFYLLLPLEAARVTGWASATGAVFLISTVTTLLLQVRVSQALARRMSSHGAIVVGLLLSAVSFIAGAGSATWLSAGGRNTAIAIVLAASIPVALATAFLAIGLNVAQPFALSRAADFARPGLTGTYLGVYASAGGLVAAGGNTVIGYLTDLGERWHLPALPWLALALLAAGSAVAITAIRPPRVRDQGETGHGEVPAARPEAPAAAGS
ncbi:MFS transporter [Micromonospora sp. DSM 115977]|uniref:MFS transporter n=1 Tax=Micromonospora reichwaldensis TaxID=3075516 RepID=A0ABU2WZP3_9ACTN|nr:MFS transporter [Micromonospora sp. DSM 115977]MDT0530846.1 MFS transporter [Micromonospora sp. DSM 115977]